ncbi:MAG: hypothetical protein DRR08_25250 [Candidatus Parabeggiatoa sp. nov. 2]|nr:MAG: hypothetical protein B6247_27850 [Beggiatoa sp. 4572_84]RKZ55096.1 MAG: hypothetical protein DRR08_25250 [Gammaproteobacteria bacterium]HEC84586.1 hypothetical protein [Thioploca sp.]
MEFLLAQHPDVQEVVVSQVENQHGKLHLVAYIVSDLIPKRIPYQDTCLVELDQNTITLHTEDISYNGLCLVGDTYAFKKGKRVRLRLLLPGYSEERWLKGKVAWCLGDKAGIQLSLTPTEQAIVRRSVNYLLETQGFLKVLQRLITRRLRKYLKQNLSDDRGPEAFVILPALPLTSNGQVDYNALSAQKSFFYLDSSN